MSADEVAAAVEFIYGRGADSVRLWVGHALAYVARRVRVVLSVASRSESWLKRGAVSALAGWWAAIHVRRVIPQ